MFDFTGAHFDSSLPDSQAITSHAVRAFVFLVLCHVVCAAPLHAAPIAYGTAEILWNSLEITTAPGVTLTYSNYWSRSIVSAHFINADSTVGKDLGSSNEENDTWSDGTQATFDLSEDDYSLHGSAATLVDVEPNLYAKASASSDNLAGQFSVTATAQRRVFFQVSGSGYVRFGVPYRLSMHVESDLGNEASGHALALMQIWPFQRSMPYIGTKVTNVGSYADSVDGWMYLEHIYSDGDFGDLQIWAQVAATASSPIRTAEPAGMALLAIGFAALYVGRKERRACLAPQSLIKEAVSANAPKPSTEVTMTLNPRL